MVIGFGGDSTGGIGTVCVFSNIYGASKEEAISSRILIWLAAFAGVFAVRCTQSPTPIITKCFYVSRRKVVVLSAWWFYTAFCIAQQ